MILLADLKFPTIDEIVRFRPFAFKGADGSFGTFSLNKIGLECIIAAALTLLIFFLAGRKKALVPRGIQSIAESGVDFVKTGIIDQTMGHGADAAAWLPYLVTLFFFIFFCNLFEIIPGAQMPATARMAIPLFLALFTYVLFIITGLVKQGPKYFKEALFPPGVPPALYILVTPIELLSTFVVRPFSLAVRLFANTLAGHILLVTFTVLAQTLLTADAFALKPIAVFPFIMLVLMTGFELMVAFLQAYIFTILTAVYIGGALNPAH